MKGCILCLDHRRGKAGLGYPELKVAGRTMSVARHTWERERGDIPVGYVLHNKCGDLRCVNMDHYEVLSNSDLVKVTCTRGEDKQNSKLTEVDVIHIKRSDQGYKSLARDYGVSWSTIRNIKKGFRWAHVS